MLCTVCHIVRIRDPSLLVQKVQRSFVLSSYVWLSAGVRPDALSSVNQLRQVRHTWFRQVHIYIDRGHWVPRYIFCFRFLDFPSVRSELCRSTSVTSSLVPIYCQISVRKYFTAVDTSVHCGYFSLDSGTMCRVASARYQVKCTVPHAK